MLTEEEWKEEWKIHQEKIKQAQDWIRRIDEALEMKHLSPQLVEKIKRFNKSIRPEHGEQVNLTIKN